MTTPFFGVLLRGEEEAIPKIFAGIQEIEGLLKKHEGPFVLGEQISIGDLGVAPFIGRILAAGRAGLLPDSVHEKLTGGEYKVFTDYAEALTSRESFKVRREARMALAGCREGEAWRDG